jgi:hypothetical protein
MNMNRTNTVLVLLTALLVTATGSLADLPAQEANVWAPVGDLVGHSNHGTITMQVLDAYGFEPKYSEDWQLNRKFGGSLLLGWRTIGQSGEITSLRTYGGTGLDGHPQGHLTFGTAMPGKYGVTFDYRRFENHYDTTSEMRAPSFAAGPVPPALDSVPDLDWNRMRVAIKYNLGSNLHLDAGYRRMHRDGTKGSLLRGAGGSTVPAVKSFGTTTDAFHVGTAYSGNALAARLKLDMRSSKGDRSLDAPHAFNDDQLLWNLNLDASYDLSPRVRVLGGGLYSRLASDQAEVYGGADYLTQSEAKTSAGQLGLHTRVGSSTTLRLGGQYQKMDSEAQTYDDGYNLDHAMTRERTRTLVRAKLVNTGVAKTHLQLHYNYESSDLQELVAQGGLPEVTVDNQATDQERTRQNLGAKVRYRFNRQIGLKISGDWKKTEITETTTGSGTGVDWLYRLGNRDIDNFKWQVALQMKPTADLKLDLGHQGISRTITRTDLDDVETTWSSQSGFVMANWAALPRLSVLASASLGVDKYELTDGPVSSGSQGPLTYDGTTLRFAPGVVYTFSEKLNVEAIYEGVRFEDKGDAPDEGNQLNSDLDNLLLRVGYNVGEQARVTAAYRRQEFDENRWDDYILDIYSVSVSGKF